MSEMHEYNYPELITKGITVSVCIQLMNWALSYFLSIDNFTGCLNFNTLFLSSLLYCNANGFASKQLTLTFLGVLWNIRLTYYLLVRMKRRGGRDTRMDRMRQNPINLAKFWVIHASWCMIVSLPVTLVNSIDLTLNNGQSKYLDIKNSSLNSFSFSFIEIIGLLIFFYGFIVEHLADFTKLAHWGKIQDGNESKQENKTGITKFCQMGIWKYSRNPNFGGEIILWFGMAIVSSNIILDAFSDAMDKDNTMQLGISTYTQYIIAFTPFLAPIFTAIVLLFLSGANLHEWKDQKLHGKDAKYINYRKTTSPVWPCPTVVYTQMPDWIKTTIMCEWEYYVYVPRSRRKGPQL